MRWRFNAWTTYFDRMFAHWAAAARLHPDTIIKAKFSFDAFYQQHERGEISAAEYFAALRRSLGMPAVHVRSLADIEDSLRDIID